MFNVKEVTDQLIKWIQDEFKARHSEKAVIGISGGKDSTICAMLAVLALGKENVFGVMIPNGIQKDISDSMEVCNLTGINKKIINIESAYEGLTTQLGKMYGYENFNTVYTTNTPARLRMTTLYGVAAILGKSLVVNTCNRSENYISWATKFGDAAGDISFLGSLTVREVLAIGEECAERLNLVVEMNHLIFKAPSDGMCGKTDEDSFGFTYEVLDNYLLDGILPPEDILAKIEKMHTNGKHKLEPIPEFEYICK